MSELKPCPFCGGDAELDFAKASFIYTDVFGKAHDSGFFYTVRCIDNVCGCHIGIYEEPKMAMEAWNRRTSDEGHNIQTGCD